MFFFNGWITGTEKHSEMHHLKVMSVVCKRSFRAVTKTPNDVQSWPS